MRVVVLGIDQHAQADAIRWIYIDLVNQKINILSIPRDFWVTVYDMAPHDITEGRINATYGYGEYFNGEGKGIDSLQFNLEQNFGVARDRYIVLYFDQIKTFIDIVGGIDLTLPEPVTDGSSTFEAGEHHMDGETAVIYMRMRYYDTDFFRVRRQSQVLTAFFNKVMTGLSVKQMFDLATRFLTDKSTQTNLSVKDVYSLICVARNLDRSNVEFVEIPRDLFHGTVTSGGGQVLIPHSEVPAFIQSVMDGTYIPPSE
jgi:LCP family protein required for cell wall assembly